MNIHTPMRLWRIIHHLGIFESKSPRKFCVYAFYCPNYVKWNVFKLQWFISHYFMIDFSFVIKIYWWSQFIMKLISQSLCIGFLTVQPTPVDYCESSEIYGIVYKFSPKVGVINGKWWDIPMLTLYCQRETMSDLFIVHSNVLPGKNWFI